MKFLLDSVCDPQHILHSFTSFLHVIPACIYFSLALLDKQLYNRAYLLCTAPGCMFRPIYRLLGTLVISSVFLIFPTTPHAVFASWQLLPDFSRTNITGFVANQEKLFGFTDQFMYERRFENGFYSLTPTTQKTFANPDFQVKSVAFDNNIFYAALPYSSSFGPMGVYTSTDSGVSWKLNTETVTNPKVIAAKNGTIFVGTTDSLWKSTDGGKVWVKKLANTGKEFRSIKFTESGILAAATTAIYTSSDNGETWQQQSLPQSTYFSLGTSGNLVFAGGQFSGLLRSEDSGKTWQTIFSANEIADHPVGPFAFAPNGKIYASGYHLVDGTTTGTVYESSDSGKTWLKINDGIVHAYSTTRRPLGLEVFQNKLYASFEQDGIFVSDISSPVAIQKKTPLILLPGIGGSEFKAASKIEHKEDNGHGGIFSKVYEAGEMIWVNVSEAIKPGNDDYFDVLRMQKDGITPLHNEVILSGNFVESAYGDFVKFFTDNGYTLNKDLFLYPYDWRKDITINATLMDAKVEEIRKQTGSDKVDIVGHSMGGLVARKYTDDPAQAAKVRKVITLGAPFLGSVNFLKTLHYGTCLTPFESLPGCLGINDKEVSDVVQNAVGGYQLAPSATYFDVYTNFDTNHPFPLRDDRDADNNGFIGSLNYTQTKEYLKNFKHNTDLYTTAEGFHSLDLRLNKTNGVQSYAIVGSGKCTLGRLREYEKSNFLGLKTIKREENFINGDGTVPLLSASLNDTGSRLLSGETNIYYVNGKHGELVKKGSTLALVNEILNDTYTSSPNFSTSPYEANCKQISVLSPVLIDAYDANGNHTGRTADGNFEANIPGSDYDEIDEGKNIILPPEGTYTIKLTATDPGSFDLKVKDISNSTEQKTVLFKDVPIEKTTKGALTYDASNGSITPLTLDIDGNGSIDKTLPLTSVATGAGAADTMPPKTTSTISGPKGLNGWYVGNVTVKLSAQDNQAGVEKVEYSLDKGKTVQSYDKSLTITTEGRTTLQFRAIDKAGNEEAIQTVELKIDKTPPEAEILYNLQNQSFDITGKDNIGSVSVNANDTDAFIQDESGNSIKLGLSYKEPKKKEAIKLTSIQYNDENVQQLPDNEFNVKSTNISFVVKFMSLTQKILIKGEERALAEYNSRQNTTKITAKTNIPSKSNETRQGIILLKMQTDKGNLQVNY